MKTLALNIFPLELAYRVARILKRLKIGVLRLRIYQYRRIIGNKRRRRQTTFSELVMVGAVVLCEGTLGTLATVLFCVVGHLLLYCGVVGHLLL